MFELGFGGELKSLGSTVFWRLEEQGSQVGSVRVAELALLLEQF